MTLEEFRATLTHNVPPEVPPVLQALWHAARGDWDRAHRIAQDVNDAAGAWVHAYLHRKEGDLSNAQYWYHRAGRPEASGPLSEEWDRMVSELCQSGLPVTDQIRFDDGAAYERYMGKWSQLAGETFLDWLAPQSGLRWLDVGCGNGAFTEMLVERCAPVSVQGIDPSEGQLAYARTRPVSRVAQFRQGDAMEQPFPDDTFDAAVMPLVIFFVPDPAKGVAEMARVVCPGGIVTAYAWDMLGGGFPYQALQAEMRALGVAVPVPPSPGASRIDAMRDLWTGAGVDAVETREITVRRTFADFDDYWTTILGGPSVGSKVAAMASEDLAVLKARMRARLSADATGRITCSARANAVKGRVPN